MLNKYHELMPLLERLIAGGYIGADGRLINDPAFIQLMELATVPDPSPKLPQLKQVGTPKTKGKTK